MRILLVATAFNGLCQRLHRELNLSDHLVSVETFRNDEHLIESVTLFSPDIILCPYLKERIPTCIWEKYLCLIVHPGIAGDRGPSSLDWAVSRDVSHWGVTLIQAAEQMDAGDIWGTAGFPMREGSKASIYRREVTRCAVKLVMETVKKIQSGGFRPTPLNYDDPDILGTEMPLMRQQERRIDWNGDTTADIVRKISLSDSFPGVLDHFLQEPVYLYGAKAADRQMPAGKPGDIVSCANGALCLATVDGAVWIRIARRKYGPDNCRIKLPAAQVLSSVLETGGKKPGSLKIDNDAFNDIRSMEYKGVGYLYFDFYNGAMNTDQCRRLQKALRNLKRRPVSVIVLMGGEDFWSNGINLNSIEAAGNQAQYAWDNINAMNDLVREIIDSPRHLMIAAVRCNAGAGGAIMPLACDSVILRDGVVLNPHYGLMGLYGSEYWTYLLPRRVGEGQAEVIMRECMPMLAREALMSGIADDLFDEDWSTYHDSLQRYAEDLAARPKSIKAFLKEKRSRMKADGKIRHLEQYRKEELKHMYESFFDMNSDFHIQRHRFVHKLPSPAPHCRLAIHRPQETGEWNWVSGKEQVLQAG